MNNIILINCIVILLIQEVQCTVVLLAVKEEFNNSTQVTFSCYLSIGSHDCSAEFLYNKQTLDTLRSSKGKCYHKLQLCSRERCSCSQDCNTFILIITNQKYKNGDIVGCEVQHINDEKILSTTEEILYNGSVFQYYKTHVSTVAKPDRDSSTSPTVEVDMIEFTMNRLQRSHQPTVSSVLDRISNTLRGIKRQYSANTLEPEAAHRQVDEVLRNLTRLEGSDSLPDADLKRAIRSVKEFKENLPHHKETSEEPELNRYGQTIPNQFGKGRNQLDIDMTKFQQLLQLGFTVKQIAEDGLLGGVIHVNTLYRKLKENNIQIRSSFSNMPDDELQGLISDYNRDHPNAGALEVQAYLKTKGVNVQRQRCRDILGRVDPLGTATRWSCTIQRRQYSVPTANSVWHVDTHHSLIRWGIIVHGGIDGHSRLIPFLRASTFNTSKAAACFFVQGVKNYGVPSRIRADHGTEYADTGRFMISVNGEGRGSFMTGPSVHNQRIERLWRDIFIKVLDVFYKLFCLMEEQNILNTTNSIHRWVLQYVFVPRIDFALREWMNTHNNHKIRTEGNKTPNMMWFKSLLLGNPEKNTSIRNIENPPDERVDEVIQTLNLELNGTIFLKPRDNCPLIEDEFTELRNTIDITKYSVSHGLDVFRDVMLHVMSKQT